MARILVADDEKEIRRVIVTTLRREGHDVVEAENGAEAGKVLAHETPDLIITDVVMPDRDGLEMLMGLQNEGRWVRVVAISGAREQAELFLRMAKRLGAVK